MESDGKKGGKRGTKDWWANGRHGGDVPPALAQVSVSVPDLARIIAEVRASASAPPPPPPPPPPPAPVIAPPPSNPSHGFAGQGFPMQFGQRGQGFPPMPHPFYPNFPPTVFMPSAVNTGMQQPFGFPIQGGSVHDSGPQIELLMQQQSSLQQREYSLWHQLISMRDRIIAAEIELQKEQDLRMARDLDLDARRKTEEQYQRDVDLYKAQAKEASDQMRALEERWRQEKEQRERDHKSKEIAMEESLSASQKEIEQLKKQQFSLKAQLSRAKGLEDELRQERKLRQDLEQQIGPVIETAEEQRKNAEKYKEKEANLRFRFNTEVKKRKAMSDELEEERGARRGLEGQLAVLRRVGANLAQEQGEEDPSRFQYPGEEEGLGAGNCLSELDDLLFGNQPDELGGSFGQEVAAAGPEAGSMLEEEVVEVEKTPSFVMRAKGDPETFFGSNIDLGAIRK